MSGAFQPHYVDCEIASGVHNGRRVFILCMVFTSDDESGLPFMLRRRQLPLMLRRRQLPLMLRRRQLPLRLAFVVDGEQVAGTDAPQSGA